MQSQPRIIKIFGNMMIKFLVLVLGNFALMTRPQRRTGIDRLFTGLAQTQDNRIINMVGISADNLAQINRIRKVFVFFFQNQLYFRSVGFFFGFSDFKTVHAVRFPVPSLLFSGFFGQDFNLGSHHKRRIKTNPELSD